MEGSKKERLYIFDNMKVYLIFLVVVGHILVNGIHENQILRSIYYFIYLFHMPVFVFISGYFSKNIEKCRDQAIQNFLIPYVTFSVLMYGFNILITFEAGAIPSFSIMRPSWGLWYLLAMFLWRMLLKDLVRIRFILPLCIVASLLTGMSREFTSYLTIGRVVSLMVFFVLGYYCNYEWVKKIRKIPKIVGALAVAVTYGISVIMVYIFEIEREFIYMKKGYPEGEDLKGMLVRLAVYIGAFLMIFAILNLASDKKRWYSYMGGNSICAYVFHLFIIILIENYVSLPTNPLAFFITTIVIAFVVVGVLTLPAVRRVYDKIIEIVNAIVYKKDKA